MKRKVLLSLVVILVGFQVAAGVSAKSSATRVTEFANNTACASWKANDLGTDCPYKKK